MQACLARPCQPFWPLFTTTLLPLLLTRITATATAVGNLGQGSVLLNQTVSAQRQGKLFVVLDKLSIDYVVPLAEIEDTVEERMCEAEAKKSASLIVIPI